MHSSRGEAHSTETGKQRGKDAYDYHELSSFSPFISKWAASWWGSATHSQNGPYPHRMPSQTYPEVCYTKTLGTFKPIQVMIEIQHCHETVEIFFGGGDEKINQTSKEIEF